MARALLIFSSASERFIDALYTKSSNNGNSGWTEAVLLGSFANGLVEGMQGYNILGWD